MDLCALEFSPIEMDGNSRVPTNPLSSIGQSVCVATAKLYAKAGFEEPWLGYLALQSGKAVGSCGFKSPPKNGKVEIAYFSFPEHEGRGLATHMAQHLVAIARNHTAATTVTAQTLKERNASHRVLEKLGFQPVEVIENSKAGPVLVWHLA